MASVNREMREYARERVAQVEARIERRLEAAAARIQRAEKRRRGARLSVEEVRAIRPAKASA